MYLHPSLVESLPHPKLAEILEAFPAGLELTPERVTLLILDGADVKGMAGMLLHPEQFGEFLVGYDAAAKKMAGNSVGHLFCELMEKSQTNLWVGMPIDFDYENPPVPDASQYGVGRVVPIMRNSTEFPGVFSPVAFYVVLWSTPHRVGGRIVQTVTDL